MAQFKLAKFLSEALSWKARFPKSESYGSLHYKSFIYPWARRIFVSYSRLYPDDNDFTQKIVKDLTNKESQLLRTINPEVITSEQVTANAQFEAQAQAQQINPQPATVSSPAQNSSGGLHSAFNPTTATPERSEAPIASNPEATLPTPTKRSFRFPKIPPGFLNSAKNMASAGGRFFYKNIGSRITLNTAITGFTTILGGIVGRGLGGNIGMAAGGLGGGLLPSFVRSGGAGSLLSRSGNGIINFGARLSNPTSRLTSRLSTPSVVSPGKRIVIGLLLGLIALMFGLSIFGALFSGKKDSPSTAEAGAIGSGCPDTSTNIASCRYLKPSIDLFNNSISQSDVTSYINKYSQVFINSGKGNLAEFIKRVNYIVSNAQTAGLNPAIFLAYWKSESNFSTIGSRDMGCVGDNFYEQVDCALGINKFSDPAKNPIANCARSRDANSTSCTTLKSIRKTFDQSHPVAYPISTLDDFAESYGPYGDLSAGSPTNCSHTYNTLIDVSKELNSCRNNSAGLASSQSNITANAAKITGLLSKGSDRFFNVKSDEPGVYYWCTYLIVDSYSRAGLSGLSRPSYGAVLSMKNFFANTSGYKLLPANTPVGQLRSGDTIFFEGSGDQHVSLINSVDLDQQGNGVIKTYESNNVVIEDSVFVKGFKAISAQTTANKYSITGFGQSTL